MSRFGQVPLCVVLVAGVLAAGKADAKRPPVRHGESVAAQDTEHPGGLPPHPMQRPGYLGVSLRDLDAAEATRLNLRGAMGAMIVTVDRDAPAWTAGLRPHDVVVEINGEVIDGVEVLRRRLRGCPSGETITLRVRRGEEEMSYSVALGDQDTIAQNALSRHLRPATGISTFAPIDGSPWVAPPTAVPASTARGMASTLFDALIPGSRYTGLEVDPLTPQLAAYFGVETKGGLLVTAVSGGSPAATAGLAAGDVIVRAANKPVTTRSSLAHALREGKGNAIPLAVLRDHKEIILGLLPGRRKKL